MTDTGTNKYKMCRKKARLTQDEACERLCISERSTLSRYECGHVLPDDGTIKKMSQLYGDDNVIIYHLRQAHPEFTAYIPYPQSEIVAMWERVLGEGKAIGAMAEGAERFMNFTL